MFQTILLLGLVLPFISAATYNPTEHVLCGTAGILPTDAAKRGSSIVGSLGCRNLCTAENFKWTYYSTTINSGSNTCYCSNLSPVEAGVTSSVNTQTGACSNSVYAVNRLATTYNWETCYTTAPVGSTSKYNGPDLNLCLSACAFDQWMGIRPTAGNYDCWCGPNAPTSTNQILCAVGRYHTLSHPADAAVSGLTRRNLKERLAMAKRAAVCPGSLDACLIGGGSEDFECIDTQSELESCGGCTYGDYKGKSKSSGVDCTSLPGVLRNSIACNAGKCVSTKCQKGYKLVDGSCKRSSERH